MSGGQQGTPVTTSVTPSTVKEIFATGLTDGQLQAFITTAEALFETYASACGYSDEMEAQLVKYLAAHLASIREQAMESESIGDASMKRRLPSGKDGLSSTWYGQTVLQLDSCGAFAQIGMKRPGVTNMYTPKDA
jgi:hypothetical protein